MEDSKHDKYRIVTMITREEKAALQILAAGDGRSMSGYLRSMLAREINEYMEPQ